jgi:hypothetical protein
MCNWELWKLQEYRSLLLAINWHIWQTAVWQANGSSARQKKSPHFIELEGSSPFSQHPPILHLISLRSLVILTSHLRLDLQSGLLSLGFSTKPLWAFILSRMLATCPTHLVLLHEHNIVPNICSSRLLELQTAISVPKHDVRSDDVGNTSSYYSFWLGKLLYHLWKSWCVNRHQTWAERHIETFDRVAVVSSLR